MINSRTSRAWTSKGLYLTIQVSVNSKIIAFIYYCDFKTSLLNVRLIIASLRKPVCKFSYEIQECEVLYKPLSLSRNIHNNKNITFVSDFTVIYCLITLVQKHVTNTEWTKNNVLNNYCFCGMQGWHNRMFIKINVT